MTTPSMSEWLMKASSNLVQSGILQERQRVIKLIEPHLEVCNYKAVTEEDCDVCHWVKTTIKQIESGENA